MINRVTILHIRVDVDDWLSWADCHGVRPEIRGFISYRPEALMGGVPNDAVPFSTPRAWSHLSRALDMAERSGILNNSLRRVLAFGRLSAEDAVVFCALVQEAIAPLQPLLAYIENPTLLPQGDAARWFVLNCIRQQLRDDRLTGVTARGVNRFLRSLPPEHQLTLVGDLVERWAGLGANPALFDLLKSVAAL